VTRRGLAALAALLVALQAHAADIAHDLKIKIDPAARTLVGEDHITVTTRSAVTLALSGRFTVEMITVDGTAGIASTSSGDVARWRVPQGTSPREIRVRWRGTLDPLDATLTHRQTLAQDAPVAGPVGTFLPASSRWYPAITSEVVAAKADAEDGASPTGRGTEVPLRNLQSTYKLDLSLPSGQKGLVAGRLVEESEAGGRYVARFAFAPPDEGIDLMAGPYQVESRDVRTASGKAVKLRTYFHGEIAALSGAYLDAVKEYIDLYERWIGEYPFTEFSVVSSPTPTGFGMPTLTYLGVDVLQLPFIRATSLGHEVLHNWWGNGVRPDYARGNWSEGLTTFMADYAYKERDGAEAAREMRLAWLRDLAAVPPGQDRPLGEFVARTHGTSQIVGYHKVAMMFLMLRDDIGSPAFDDGVRRFWREQRFKVASWDDLRHAFEAASGRDLEPFFAQWLSRAGVPSIRLAGARVEKSGERHRIEVLLEQVKGSLRDGAAGFRVRVPLVVRTEHGEETHIAEMDRERARVTLYTAATPVAVTLDPDLRVLRRLVPDEAPPVLRQAMVDEATTTMIVASGKALEVARDLAGRLQDAPPRLLGAGDSLPHGPVLVIGLEPEIRAWLARQRVVQKPDAIAGKGTAQVWMVRRKGAGPLAVVSARDADSLAALARPLPHYGRQSYLAFDGAKVIERGVFPTKAQTVVLAKP